MSEDRKRHCWECRRRCLVCDFGRPACSRCVKARIECPGYGDSPPMKLKWLAPGKVKSRSWRVKSAGDQDQSSSSTASRAGRTKDAVNQCIYPDICALRELGFDVPKYEFSPSHFQHVFGLPEYIRFGLVCMSLSHRMSRTPNGFRSNALAEPFYRYRGLIIRGLRDDMDVEHKRTCDSVIAGILTILLADAHQGASSHWRTHLEGLQKIITLRGGIRVLAKQPRLLPLLLSFVFVTVIGDSTAPASDMVMTSAHFKELELLLEEYGKVIFAFQMCPTPLFAEIVKINHIRVLSLKQQPTEVDLLKEGYKALHRVQAFSSEEWAENKPASKKDWLLLADVYQVSTELFCLLSLQSLAILPRSPLMRENCNTHAELLQVLLEQALVALPIKRFLLWPMVVLGVEAAQGGALMRAFVREQLPELSRYIGTYVPLMAQDVLERFWDSGKARWDDCFDKPYAFATQIGLDMSAL
ncbi:C6 zinc finger domain-containing protein [Penicillium capsulatum]|uniref:C6 zinc finger domain-containing protein n=1 Tax=Penicillium capsulatum TaxID=69766 RepID=A0A9W9HMJ0_9EURO|nr:C6 zinc finger domain-containing protein [Penicillium capsulatum]